VVVAAGTYVESVTNWPSSGSSGNPIIVQANPGDTVIWRGSGSDVNSLTGAISIMDRNNIRIEGFRFDGTVTAATIRALHTATTNKTSSPMVGIEIINNSFTNNGNSGASGSEMSRTIYFQYLGQDSSYTGSTLSIIRGNSFIDNYGASIDFDGSSDVLVEQNTSSNMHGSKNLSNGNYYQANFLQAGGYNTAIRNIIQYNTAHEVIKDSYIPGDWSMDGAGIRMDVGASNSIIRGNIFYNIGYEAPWDGTRHFNGIFCEAGCVNNAFIDNLIYKTNETCLALGSTATTKAQGNAILNNTLYDCGRVALYIENAQNTTVQNNIIAGNAASLVTVTPQSITLGGNVWSNNLWFKPGTTLFGLWSYDPNSQGWGTGDLDLSSWKNVSGEPNALYADPLFVNPSTGDFHLQSTSPAIDTGTSLSEVPTDLTGTTRPQSCCYDIGVYEFGALTTFPSPPAQPPPPASLFIPGRLEAENYNAGGQNVGYFDTTPGNLGGACNTDDVDIKDVANDGCTVAYTEPGEWLAYTVNIVYSGAYQTSFRIANGSSVSQIVHLEIDGQNITGPVTIPSSGSYSTQVSIPGPTVNLTQGNHLLKLYFDTGLVDINWMDFQSQILGIPLPPSDVQVILF